MASGPCPHVEAPEGSAQVVCVDSSKPDLDDGEIGRELYGWILDAFSGCGGAAQLRDAPPLVAIPGTGRDRNQVGHGEALEVLRSAGVDIVLGGTGTSSRLAGSGAVPRPLGHRLDDGGCAATRGLIQLRDPHRGSNRGGGARAGGKRERLARYPRPSFPIGERRNCSFAAARRSRFEASPTESRGRCSRDALRPIPKVALLHEAPEGCHGRRDTRGILEVRARTRDRLVRVLAGKLQLDI